MDPFLPARTGDDRFIPILSSRRGWYGQGMRAPKDGQGRPILDHRLRRVIRSLTESRRLGHVDPEGILIVAGSARRSSRASIRGFPEAEDVPRVSLRGQRIWFEICLRPQFFLRTTPRQRLELLIHELWHIGPGFDGTLDPSRRHHVASAEEAERFVRGVLADVRAPLDSLTLPPEARLSAWLDRPPGRIPASMGHRRIYDERDLFPAVVRSAPVPPPAA